MRPRGENIDYDKLRDRYDVLAAQVSLLTQERDTLKSEYADLAGEMAAERESNAYLNNLHTLDVARIAQMEAQVESLRDSLYDCTEKGGEHRGHRSKGHSQIHSGNDL